MKKSLVFFLGGIDAEMIEIMNVLKLNNIEFYNKNLGWGAAASAYAAEIETTKAAGKVPVLVELIPDIALSEGIILVDHHGERAGEPASIMQVLSLLNIEPTRWDLLIAANDSGFIPAMEAMGATAEEIVRIRAADRLAQGITAEQEAEAEAAISKKEVSGKLTTIRLAHSKCATVTDRLHKSAGGSGYDQLLIISADGEVNFYGDGTLCATLKENFNGWNGGSGLGVEGGNAYWGGYPNQSELEKFIREYFVHE